jgi:hypothetical protein
MHILMVINIVSIRYTISRVPDGTFGGVKSDGVSWSGMVGQLQRKVCVVHILYIYILQINMHIYCIY